MLKLNKLFVLVISLMIMSCVEPHSQVEGKKPEIIDSTEEILLTLKNRGGSTNSVYRMKHEGHYYAVTHTSSGYLIMNHDVGCELKDIDSIITTRVNTIIEAQGGTPIDLSKPKFDSVEYKEYLKLKDKYK